MKGKLLAAWRTNRMRLLKYGLPLALLIGLLVYRLGSLVPGLSPGEQSQLVLASSWHAIIRNPLNAPLSVGQWVLLTIFDRHSPWLLRLPSVLIGLVAIISFWYVLRRWYGARTAAYGTIVFAISNWLLHTSRFGGPAILITAAIPILLASFIIWEQGAKRLWVHYLIALTLVALAYIPGVIWFILLVVGLQNRQIIQAWRILKSPLRRICWLATFIIPLMALGYAATRDKNVWINWLGLPSTFGNPGAIPHRLIEAVSFFVWRGPLNPELWLDRLAILSAFSIIMLVLGVIFYARHLTAPRTRLLASLYILGALFYAIGGPVGFGIIVPVVYLIIAAGIGYLLHQWLKVFPKNPVARGLGYTLLALVVALTCSYDLRAYFVAWPAAPSTQTAFREQR